MTRDQAKDYVKSQLENYLTSTGRPTKQAFNCLNPDHPDRHPSMSFDPRRNKCKCFSCGADYDTFDIIGIDYNVSGEDMFQKAFAVFGLTVENDRGYQSRSTAQEDFKGLVKGVAHNQPKNEQVTQHTLHNTQYTTAGAGFKPLEWNAVINAESKPAMNEKERPDFTQIIEQAHQELINNPQALAHFTQRGLTLETIRAHKLGYCEGGYNSLLQAYPQHQTKSKKAGLYKYVFPVLDQSGHCSYFITEISDRQSIDNYNGKYRKINEITPASLYNEQYIGQNSPETIFICEGVFDALSVEQEGGHAIALTGTGYNRLLTLCEERHTRAAFIIALDADQAGAKATATLKEGFNKLGLHCIIARPNTGKDANEALQSEPEAFKEYVRNAEEQALQLKREQEQEEQAEYKKSSAAYQLQAFIDGIARQKTASYFSTGFASLDAALDGGLYAGLYCVGAISSLGKTTFCLQIADNLAAAGQDVLIFSLEMAKEELIAKSISRHTLLEDWKQGESSAKAKTTRGILTGSRYRYYTAAEQAIIAAALQSYEAYADHIYISEGIGNIGVAEIREAIEKHIRVTGVKPAVIIDYLQIIAPADPRSTDKQNTDKAVLELKRMSRDYSIPVIGISSFNRDNYHAPVNLASFKESGAIEYSSDVLIGLQYAGMDYFEGESEKERDKRTREILKRAVEAGKLGEAQHIQVKVLKNRNGSKGESLLDFYPMFNYFRDSETQEITKGTEWAGSPSKGKTTEKKVNQREQLKQQLLSAFHYVEKPAGSGSATLEDLAEQLEIKKSTVKSRLKEFTQLFEIEGETVTLKPQEPEPSPELDELTLFDD